MNSLSGKTFLQQQTPRSPLKIQNMETLVDLQDDIPRIPSSKKFKKEKSNYFDSVCIVDELSDGSSKRHSIRRPITSELVLQDPNTLTYYHRFRDSSSFENKHKRVLERQPAAFHRQRGQCLEQLTQYCFQDRAFPWKSSDGRQSVSPSNPKYLIESLSYDPIDLDITIARTVDFSQSRSLKSRHSTARSKREGRVSSISSVKYAFDDEGLVSSSSKSTTGRSASKIKSDMYRRREEDEETISQIAQFEARIASTSNFSSMSKRDLVSLKSAVKKQRQENSKDDASFKRSISINKDDSLAWTCVKPISQTFQNIQRALPDTVEVALPSKKNLLYELGICLNSLKLVPTISLRKIVICDVLCNVHIFANHGSSVNIVLEKVVMGGDDYEITRLILTKEKMSKYTIPLVPSDKSKNEINSYDSTRYYEDKVKEWFLFSVLPRVVLFAPLGIHDYTINLLPFKVSKLKGSKFSLAVLPENLSDGITDVDPNILRPNPRLVNLYFQNL